MDLSEAKKKKKKNTRLSGGIGILPDYVAGIDFFNKRFGWNKEEEQSEKDAEHAAEEASADVAGSANSTTASDGAAATGSETASGEANGDAGASTGDGGMGESLNMNLREAKRYVKRYYIRPQNKFCSNKEEILKSLAEIGDENCSVYTLKELDDHDDVHLLKSSDIIYYYDDGILYDKNHVKVMDYDLFVKNEEKRKHFGDVDSISDATFDKAYADRLTETYDYYTSLTPNELKDKLANGEQVYLGYNTEDSGRFLTISHEQYSATEYSAIADGETYCLIAQAMGHHGEEGESWPIECRSFEELLRNIKKLQLADCPLSLKEGLAEDIYDLADTANYSYYKHLTAEELQNKLDSGEQVYLGYNMDDIADYPIVDEEQYGDTEYSALIDQGNYYLIAQVISHHGGEGASWSAEYHTLDELLAAIKDLRLDECPIDFTDSLAEEAFNLNYRPKNLLGESIDDQTYVCCICGEEFDGYGNNPEPVKHSGRCCDACNNKFVIPARLAAFYSNNDEEDN